MSNKNKEVEDWMVMHSARYILEDLNHEEGMKKMAEIAGLPMGVIVEAFKTIFNEEYLKGIEKTP